MTRRERTLKCYGGLFEAEKQSYFSAKFILSFVFAVLLTCAAVVLFLIATTREAKAQVCPALTLTASWYSEASLKKEGTWKTSKGVMANGKQFNENALTCATRDFRLEETLKITNINNNKSVIVKVTDRIGKRFAGKRIDLSKAAFNQIANLKQGIISVKIEAIQ